VQNSHGSKAQGGTNSQLGLLSGVLVLVVVLGSQSPKLGYLQISCRDGLKVHKRHGEVVPQPQGGIVVTPC
jgi:hypothetical protein